VVLALIFHTALLTALGSYLVSDHAPEKADVALVLAGGEGGERILKGAQLVRDGYAPAAFISGPGGVYDSYECDLAIPFAVRRGFPESYFIHAEHHAHSTFEEAQAVLPEIRKRGYKRILLVTSNYHTHRAVGIFERQAPDLDFIPIAAPDAYFTANGWWHNREGQKTFLVEWEKTIASWAGL
jgi:uncharacterized SAM-binding protein YcdF (DUF218 family)